MRVRLTDTCAQGGQNLTGAAPNGEIEDYMMGWIGNYVWDDADGNGVQAFTGEPGINDVVVNLLDGSGDPVLDGDGNPITTMTAWDAFGSAGRYQFGGLPPGNYIVEFVAPTGKDFTGQDQGGNDEVDSDANPTTGRSHVISLDTGEFDDSVDAGPGERSG